MKNEITRLTFWLRFGVTILFVLFSIAFITMLIFFKAPKENEALINFVAGGVITNGLVIIVKWWFPSDINSERKTELIAQADAIKSQ